VLALQRVRSECELWSRHLRIRRVRYRPRVFSVNDLFTWWGKGELELSPYFQRRKVWSPQAQSFLIDTILSGYPIPAIQIRQKIDVAKQTTTREVVDGQQRLTAIFEFLAGNLRVLPSQSQQYGGNRYDDLSDEEKNHFLDYELPVAMLSGASEEDVLSVFARLNSYTITLNAQEKLNAKFFGLFKQTAYALGADHNAFWLKHNILTRQQILRMAEAELASELLVAMLLGLTDRRTQIEPTYKRLDDEFPERDQMVDHFRLIIDVLEQTLGEILSDTAFRRRPLFYSLYCVYYDFRFGLASENANSHKPSPIRPKKDRLLRAIWNLDKQLQADEPDQGYLRFREASLRQTDGIGPRRIRHDVLRRELFPHLG
jgi:hypothetical protein